mmetsp:Transcript_62239/g.184076  ORF Transcript_62239/g.184076 Transcript_62239/m.184076 type:complete len:230 (-) Transcript_62239:1252-1941(-)
MQGLEEGHARPPRRHRHSLDTLRLLDALHPFVSMDLPDVFSPPDNVAEQPLRWPMACAQPNEYPQRHLRPVSEEVGSPPPLVRLLQFLAPKPLILRGQLVALCLHTDLRFCSGSVLGLGVRLLIVGIAVVSLAAVAFSYILVAGLAAIAVGSPEECRRPGRRAVRNVPQQELPHRTDEPPPAQLGPQPFAHSSTRGQGDGRLHECLHEHRRRRRRGRRRFDASTCASAV